jgi:uncharacterized membrane protein
MKWIHIIAGLIALGAGAGALYAVKGSPLHRKSGMWFVIAMTVMASTAVVMATFIAPNRVNVMAGLLTLYLVITALLTVRRPVEQTRGLLTGLMLAGLLLGIYACDLGMEAMNNPNGLVDKVPAPPLFMFALVGIAGALLDARLLWAGSIHGRHRLARHLWRMGYAMFIATASFFLGQAKFFPQPIRASGVLALPVLALVLVMLYSLVRVFYQRRGVK